MTVRLGPWTVTLRQCGGKVWRYGEAVDLPVYWHAAARHAKATGALDNTSPRTVDATTADNALAQMCRLLAQ